MAKAHIKTQSGAQITVEGDSTEVAKIISQIERAPQVHAAKQEMAAAEKKKKEIKKAQTASDLIASLKEEGFFDKPKTLSEVATELEKSGYLYPVTTLSGVMLSLVQKKILIRAKKDKVWMYGKR